jgi:hypothetical protein
MSGVPIDLDSISCVLRNRAALRSLPGRVRSDRPEEVRPYARLWEYEERIYLLIDLRPGARGIQEGGVQ